jgi:hypothetical protein
MNRFQAILRGASSIFDFRWIIIPGQYEPPQFHDIQELPTLKSPGEAIASYWKATGNYIRMGMDHVQSEEGYGQESQE